MSQIQVDNIYNKEGTGSPSFPLGANVTGVVTATTFKGGAEITSGTISATSVTAASGTFNGPVTIGGTLTYEDVTNIDSVGVITARNGINVSGGTGIFAFLQNVFNSLLTTKFSILEVSLASVFEIKNVNIIKNLILNRYK